MHCCGKPAFCRECDYGVLEPSDRLPTTVNDARLVVESGRRNGKTTRLAALDITDDRLKADAWDEVVSYWECPHDGCETINEIGSDVHFGSPEPYTCVGCEKDVLVSGPEE